MPEPTPELIARLEADKRDAADRMTFEQRAVAGVSLFDIMAECMRTGIRMDHPTADDEVVEQMLLVRLRESRRSEDVR